MGKIKAVILTCIDYRFHKYIQEWLAREEYLGSIDEICVAGSTKDLVAPSKQSYKEYVLRQIDISVKLHSPHEIILLDHQDCGGYAIDNTIAGGLPTSEDKGQHKNFADNAKELLQKIYPDLKVVTKYIDLEGNISDI